MVENFSVYTYLLFEFFSWKDKQYWQYFIAITKQLSMGLKVDIHLSQVKVKLTVRRINL